MEQWSSTPNLAGDRIKALKLRPGGYCGAPIEERRSRQAELCTVFYSGSSTAAPHDLCYSIVTVELISSYTFILDKKQCNSNSLVS